MAGTPPEAARTSINASAAKVALELLARPVCAMNLIGGLGWFTGWEMDAAFPVKFKFICSDQRSVNGLAGGRLLGRGQCPAARPAGGRQGLSGRRISLNFATRFAT